MQVWTDSPAFAHGVGLLEDAWEDVPQGGLRGFPGRLLERLGAASPLFRRELDGPGPWAHLFLVARAAQSQFDVVVDVVQEGGLPEVPFLCAAGSGSGFHGFKGRPWVALAGNVHLVACMYPDKRVQQPGVGPIVLSTVAILETIDELPGCHEAARVKWVNDILVDGAKVGGVIARSQSIGDRIHGIQVGIGLNVEQTPDVPRDPFVPRAGALASLRSEGGALTLADVFPRLARNLGNAYARYLEGGYPQLLETYRRRSVVLGRFVRILEDTAAPTARELRRGRVVDIGEGLELYLDDGGPPVLTGRLVLDQVV